jgi:hypothetical protein
MANYYEHSRSNYVQVKDLEEFKKMAAKYGAEVVPKDTYKPDETYFALLWGENGFQEYPYDEDTGEDLEGDFYTEVAGHLQENSVLVVMGAGHEKLRYVLGWASAVDCTGKTVHVNIDAIYTLAEKRFKGKEVTAAEY